MQLNQFLDLLPARPERAPAIQEGSREWAEYVEAENPHFVAPMLCERRSIQPSRTSLVVISAAGAVGKTTVAREIARQTGALYVDLAKRRVGSDSASGLVLNAVGYREAARIFADLAEGRFLLVLDALDETRIGSGEENFLAFLEDVSRLCAEPRARPALILFGREEAREWTEFWLENVPLASYLIDYFDDEGARLFIKRRVTAGWHERSKSGGALGEPVWRASDEFLQLLRDAVQQRDSEAGAKGERLVRSVIGYAPVLEVVSEFLLNEEVSNYQRLINNLRAKKGRYEWDLLVEVADHLLNREQGKFKEQKLDDLKAAVGTTTWTGWSSVYSPDEQRLRLLHQRFGVDLDSPPPDGFPAQIRDRYEQAIEEQLGDHPFEGHVLFKEYLLAWLLSGRAKADPSLSDAMRRVLVRDNHRPTPGLGRFLLSLTATDGIGRIASRDFGFIYESLLSEEKRQGDLRLTIRTSRPGCVSGAVAKGDDPALQFEVTGADQEPVWFWSRLAYANIGVSCSVELGTEGIEFRLGPEVDLECGDLRCPASNLRVLAEGSEDALVVLFAGAFPRRVRPLIVRGGQFFVRGPDLRWPWRDYEDPDVTPPEARSDVVEAYNHLTRILRWFRASGYGAIARVDELVENVATGGTPAARQMVDFCVEKGLIRHSGRLYELNHSELGRYGIRWDDIRRRILREPVVTLLSDFLSRERS